MRTMRRLVLVRTWKRRLKKLLLKLFLPKWNRLGRARDKAGGIIAKSVVFVFPALALSKIVLEENTSLVISFPISLLTLYFSAFIGVVAATTYDILCPTIIRESRTYPNFFRESQIAGVEILSKYAEVRSGADTALDELLKGISVEDGGTRTSAFDRVTVEMSKAKMIWQTSQTWEDCNKSNPPQRLVLAVLFLTSAALGCYALGVSAVRVVAAL